MSDAHHDSDKTPDTEDKEDQSNVGVPDTQPPPAGSSSEARPISSSPVSTWCATPGLAVRYAGRSAVGLVREHNEDNFVIANLTTGELSPREASLTDVVGEGGLLFAVCDGMGGAAAGEVASQMAVDVLHEAMRRGGFPRERDELAHRLVSAVEEAGRTIFDSAQKERSRRGMGTTATAAVLVDKVLFVAEVGDSRAYLLRAGALKQLTKDQSLVNQLIEAGHLTEAEAEAFEHSNIILQALGTSETVQVDLTFVELRRGDRLMLCSDGLSGLVHADTLRDALATIDDPSECTAAMVKYAEAGGGHDNITVVIIDFDGDVLEPANDSDSFGYLQYPLLPAGSVPGAFSDEEITEASAPPGRASYESLPALEPQRGQPGADSNPWLWVSAGLLALLLGAWLLAASGSSSSATADEDRGLHQPVAPAAPPSAAKDEAIAETKVVPVRVYSDVQDAVLLVNGEAHGRLATGEGHNMELPPGAYRFEAQSHGNIAAVEVVTVRPEVPLDVYLRLPTGTNDPTAAHAPSVDKQTADKQTADKQTADKQTADKPAPSATDSATAAAEPALAAPSLKPNARRLRASVAPTPAHRHRLLSGSSAEQPTAGSEPPTAAAPAPATPPSAAEAPAAPAAAPVAPTPPTAPAAAAPPVAPRAAPPAAPHAPTPPVVPAPSARPSEPAPAKPPGAIPENPF
jgi:serine/threonine protein phosphatase PrpC